MRRVTDEPTETVEALEAELSVARMSGEVDDMAANAVSDDELDAMLRELAEQEAAEAAELEAAAETRAGDADDADDADDLDDVDDGGPVEDAAGVDPSDGGGEQPSDRRDEGAVAAAGDESAGASPPPPPSPSESVDAPPPGEGDKWGIRLPRPRPSTPTSPPTSTPTPAPAAAGAPVAHAVDEGESGPYVDELFARIRSERTTGDSSEHAAPGAPAAPVTGESAADGSATDGSATDGGGGGLAVAVRPDEPAPVPASAPAAPDVTDVEEASADDAPLDPGARALRRRDELLATAERDLGRKLKRVLADEQNEVLDRLRRGAPVGFAEVVPAADEHVGRFAAAAGAFLDAAAAHGAALSGGDEAPSCDDLARALGQVLVDPLRVRIERSFDDSDGDLEEVTERLRALYREWKANHIGNAVRHFTSMAYAKGAYEAAPDGAPLRWIVDRSCEACPDCDDNALAGDVAKGDAYPTGDRCAPAHPDCRCLVVSASALAGA